MHGDAVAVAILLHRTPEGRREDELARILREAEAGDRHMRSSGRRHPLWGSGSLMDVALRDGACAEPPLSDADYCLCLARVYAALAGVEGE